MQGTEVRGAVRRAGVKGKAVCSSSLQPQRCGIGDARPRGAGMRAARYAVSSSGRINSTRAADTGSRLKAYPHIAVVLAGEHAVQYDL